MRVAVRPQREGLFPGQICRVLRLDVEDKIPGGQAEGGCLRRVACAQNTLSTGVVLEQENVPVIGAAVIPGGEISKGVMTDIDGFFTIKVPKGTVLTVTCLGFADEKVTAENEAPLTIMLKPDANMLEETVVIGYGSVKKSDLTGSVVNVKLSDVLETPAVSVDNALQGRIAGAEFMSTDGAPGATTTIRIRGSRSITASNEPLFVVDGVMDAINDLNDLNSNDIASISVLKDASPVEQTASSLSRPSREAARKESPISPSRPTGASPGSLPCWI